MTTGRARPKTAAINAIDLSDIRRGLATRGERRSTGTPRVLATNWADTDLVSRCCQESPPASRCADGHRMTKMNYERYGGEYGKNRELRSPWPSAPAPKAGYVVLRKLDASIVATCVHHSEAVAVIERINGHLGTDYVIRKL
jgi:hypothetical protein